MIRDFSGEKNGSKGSRREVSNAWTEERVESEMREKGWGCE